MAKNQDCLQTNVSELRETDSLLLHDQQATTLIPSCHCTPRYQARRVRSKGAVLVLTWNLLASACPKVDLTFQPIGVFNFEIINGVVTAVLFLFAGFLADVYFGRYKVMKVSIWVMWLGSVGNTLL